jgi:integrase
LRDEHLRLINQGLQGVGGATNFAAYVEGTYNTTHFPLLASTTQSRTRGGVIEKYLIPALGKSSLRDITPLRLQQYFASFTSAKLQHESVDKIRDVLAAILSTAVRYGLIVTNPIEGIKLPKLKRGKRVKPYVTPQQFAALVDLIPEPYATMVYVAVYTGLRISELCALKWENVNEFAHSITVEVSR